MTVVELAAGYLGVGVTVAAIALARRAGTTAVDAVLLVGLWPVFGPVLAAAGSGRAAEPHLRAHVDRLAAAEARLAELDRALARPDLDEPAARARIRALEQRGAGAGAIAAATRRLHTIHRVRDLRAAAVAEADELRESLAQQRAQAELARLSRAERGECSQEIGGARLRATPIDRLEGVTESVTPSTGNEPAGSDVGEG